MLAHEAADTQAAERSRAAGDRSRGGLVPGASGRRTGGGPEVSEGTTGSVEFFGVKLKVKDPRLAALLNSDVTDDVVVIGRRAIDLVTLDDEDEAGAAPGLGGGPGAASPPAD